MNRRHAIQTLLAASVSSIWLTGCAESNVIDFLVDGKLRLNERHQDYLAAISESILPINQVTDKIESPANFILKMINDCRSVADVQKFAIGFDQYKTIISEAKSSIENEESSVVIERIKSQMLKAQPQEELIYFLQEVKGLSIQNLKTSSYYLTRKTDYQLIPQAYNACVDV